MIESTLTNPNYLLRDIDSLTGGDFHSGGFVFRGQRESSWGLETSFDRQVKATLKSRNAVFGHWLNDFRSKGIPDIDPSIPDGDLIAIAQHFGLPTRVLDWSYSPYVALFFAVSGAIMSNQRGSAALFIMNKRKIIEELDDGEFSILEYAARKELRIVNQRGLFTRIKIDESDLGSFLASRGCGDLLHKLVVPPKCFMPIARILKAMDITHARLFPGLDGIAKETLYQSLYGI